MTTPGPGLQQERTQLAWRRTTLTFAVVGLAVVRSAYLESAHLAVFLGAVAVAAAAWLAVSTLRRGRWTRPSTSQPAALHVLRDGTLPACTAVVAAASCAVTMIVSSGVLR